ncbi:Origin recognition complex subunit 3 [Ranunculus cassubicifolius]
MAPSDSPSSPNTPIENSENHLQPYFILHKPKKQAKTRRRIDLSVDSPKKSEGGEQIVDSRYEKLRVEAFDVVWLKMENRINEVLRGINTNVFVEIHQWIRESFTAIRSIAGTVGSSELSSLYPLVTDVSSKKIFTGLVFTKNVEFVDDLLTFKDLNLHLKSQVCHVVNLSSLDFSAKSGVAGCTRSLVRQFVDIDPDVADITILASWYSESENSDNPLVVIIDDMERCNGTVLSEFILMLSEWVIKLPIILVMGVATTMDATRILLPANALNCLEPCKFALGSPAERLYAIIEAVILSTDSGFHIGYEVAVFLRNYFLRQDGTISSFIKALKIACAKHFVMEPLSFLCKGLLDEDYEDFLVENCSQLPESMLLSASNLPSCNNSVTTTPVTAEGLASGLSEVMKVRKKWCSVFRCLYEAAKFQNVQVLDILCEALHPASDGVSASSTHQLGKSLSKSSSINCSTSTKVSLISQVVRKIKDLPPKSLQQLLLIWQKHSEDIDGMYAEVSELQSMLKIEDESAPSSQPELTSLPKRHASGSFMKTQRDRSKVNEKAAVLIECMVRKFLIPIECSPFHEIVCFKHVDILQSALIGDPRRMVQVDLLKSHNYLQCSCCAKSGNAVLPSMHDTSILYTMAQEHGDLINLHDWFQSFKSTVLRPHSKAKSKIQSPSSKKRKLPMETEDITDASIQARFCRAVIELQITGLLRMPNKRRPDFVQRVAFGL